MAVRRNLAMLLLATIAVAACSGDDDTSTLTPGASAPTATADATTADAIGTGTTPGSTLTRATPPPVAVTSAAAPVATTAAPPTTVAPPPPPPTEAPAPPTTVIPAVEATAYAVFDMRSGTLLAANQADAQLPVGSVMKVLAAQTAYAAGQPTKVVVAPPGLIIDPEESRIGISEGQELPRDLLIRAMLIVSANDAARMLAIDIAGSEAAFAEQMNVQAAALGLPNTHAVNATGLDADGQYSSANDMVRLGAFMMGNATFQLTVRRTDATLNNLLFPATNDLLLTYPGADGIKTGRTTLAGDCILASAQRDGRRIIVAVFGAPSEAARNAAATALLDWGFTQPG